MKYDLEDRTFKFSYDVLILCRKYKKDIVVYKIVDQLIRSATSIGGNYRVANESDSKKEFRHKIRIAKKESKETIYWLELLQSIKNNDDIDVSNYIKESKEIMLILAAIYNRT
jgi:four helix bundle protein